MEEAFQRDLLSPENEGVFECLIEEEDDYETYEESQQIKTEESDSILREKRIKKLTTKNNNLPKFLIRIFMKVAYDYAENKGITSFDHCKVKEIEQELKSRGANIWMTKDLKNIFGPDESFKKMNRWIMNKTLRSKLKDEVIQNTKVRKSKLSTLIASKVYSLRLRNEKLACRVQSR
jgi:hypothetical protein